MTSIINTNSYLLKPSMLATQLEMPFNVSLLLGLFSKIVSIRNKNSSFSVKRSSLLILSLSIMPRELSNSLLRPFRNYGKLRKQKLWVALISWGLGDSGYITDQFGSQGAFTVNKSNTNSTESSWQNLMQKGLSIIKE